MSTPSRLFVEHLTVIDCALLDPRRGLVGESWIVDLELDGDLDAQSMVLDFGEVKRRLKRGVDAVADHKLLVPQHHAGLSIQDSNDGFAIEFRGPADGPILHVSPADAVCLVDATVVDATSLAAQLKSALRAELPSNVSAVTISLRREVIDGAWYCYAHGLKKHSGHCQRIAHGHRSRLEIRVDGVRDTALERSWAERWRDIYLGTREDVVTLNDQRTRFEYRSNDGRFALELPANRCELLEGDTTVERIAQHLAQASTHERRGSRIEVRAYEGVHKGALATAG